MRVDKAVTDAIEKMEPSLQATARGIFSSAKRPHPQPLLSMFGVVNEGIKKTVPANLQPQVLALLVKRNWLLTWFPSRLLRRLLLRDISIVNSQVQNLSNQSMVFHELLSHRLHAPTRGDTVLIWLAISVQILGAVAVVFSRKNVELVVLFEAVALAISGWLVGECEGVDPKWWARFLFGATALGLIESIVLLEMG